LEQNRTAAEYFHADVGEYQAGDIESIARLTPTILASR
jgi:hypothetical protein